MKVLRVDASDRLVARIESLRLALDATSVGEVIRAAVLALETNLTEIRTQGDTDFCRKNFQRADTQ